MRSASRPWLGSVLWVVCLVSCGDDDGPGGAVDGGPTRDASAVDDGAAPSGDAADEPDPGGAVDVDGGPSDAAAPRDASAPDGARPDATPMDATALDSGRDDAAADDAMATDARPALDASSPLDAAADAAASDASAPDVALPDAGPPPPTGAVRAIEMTRWTDAGAPLPAASVTVRYELATPAVLFVNVVVDVDGNGVIAPYPVAGGATQEEWIVQDEAAVIRTAPLSHWFAVVDPAAADRDLRVRAVASAGPLGAPPVLGESAVDSLERIVVVRGIESPVTATTAVDAFGGGGLIKQPPPEHSDAFGEMMPGTITLPNGFARTGMPDPIQGANACVLSSLAVGLSWLGRTRGFADCFPIANDVETFVFFEGEIDRVGRLGYTMERGVPGPNVMPGIMTFLAETGIPVSVREVRAVPTDPMSATTIGAELVAALRNECAVMIGVQFPEGRHALSLAGLVTDPATGAARSLVVQNSQTETYADHHPISRSSGSLVLRNVARSDLEGRELGPGNVPIVSLHILCVSAVRAVTLAFPHNTIPTGNDVHLRCIEGGAVSAPDACACTHWHSGGAGISIRSEPRVFEMPANPCGHGCYRNEAPWSELEVRCCGIPE
ncbi:MAG: hypothetical protein IT379_05570 [Deltaproteobacteria bacterium]|nr:hypothetical protein [Deltaproteobacteria bacterium]